VPYASKPTPADVVAAMMRRRGIELDAQRLAENVAAQRSRERIEDRDHIANVRALAAAARKARRASELAEAFRRQSPSQANLSHAQAAQRTRKAAEDALLEAVLYDRELYRAALSEAGL
jgi:hypothetical protein